MLVREPVGVVGAIVSWNSPLSLLIIRAASALLAGCTFVVKARMADRGVSEQVIRDPWWTRSRSRVPPQRDGGSPPSRGSERIGRSTLELGGKSAAVVLDDADIDQSGAVLVNRQCLATVQVCAALTRSSLPTTGTPTLIVTSDRYDDMVDSLVAHVAKGPGSRVILRGVVARGMGLR